MLQIPIFINNNKTDERTYEEKEKHNLGYKNCTYGNRSLNIFYYEATNWWFHEMYTWALLEWEYISYDYRYFIVSEKL